MKGHIRRDDPFHQWLPPAEVDHGSKCGSCREVTPHNDLMGGKGSAANIYAGAPAGTGGVGNGDFDCVAGFDVQTM